MRVSVALCTFNGAKYVHEQLESIARQTHVPDELIVCDDGSTDTTRTILARFAERAPMHVHIFRNDTNLGSSLNFANAIDRCTGNIIFLADQDDVWIADKVQRTLSVFQSDEVDLVFSDGLIVDKHGRPMNYTLWNAFGFSARRRSAWSRGRAFDIELRCNVVTGAAMALRAELKSLVLPIAASWHHDAWIATLAALYANTRFIESCLIYYRQHGLNQVGAGRRSSHSRFRAARSGRRSKLKREYQGWCELLARIKQFDAQPEVVDKIENKMRHLDRRIVILTRRWPIRFVAILRELVRGGYARYSNGGVSAALLDLIAEA